MTNAHERAMDLIKQVQARRDAAGLKVTFLVAEPIGGYFYPFTAYAKDAEQAARWRGKARTEGTLIA